MTRDDRRYLHDVLAKLHHTGVASDSFGWTLALGSPQGTLGGAWCRSRRRPEGREMTIDERAAKAVEAWNGFTHSDEFQDCSMLTENRTLANIITAALREQAKEEMEKCVVDVQNSWLFPSLDRIRATTIVNAVNTILIRFAKENPDE
jgi:hypothetical protein